MPSTRPRLALNGIRILDLTRGWSGPIGMRFMADLGAEVIRVETLTARGNARVEPPHPLNYPNACHLAYPDNEPGEEPYNRYGPFNDYHRNKVSLTLDLTNEDCKQVFRDLVAISDVVVENYSPRVMRNFGLHYEALRQINPTIVMIGMPGFGAWGPYRNYVSYGTNIESSAGLSNLMGYDQDVPYKSGEALPDVNAGLHAVGAILAALLYRRKTGRGQYIELSQNEAMIGTIGEELLGFGMTGEEPVRMGNRHSYHAPHNAYPCKGKDRWIAIAVTSDEEWEALCQVMGNPAWSRDEKFTDQFSRWHHQDEIDPHIADWTRGQGYKELMRALQARGVPAAAVFTNQDVVEDPHLRERGYFWDIPHPRAGTRKFPGAAVKLSKTPGVLRTHAPLLGEHNRFILRELLDVPAEKIVQTEEANAIGTCPPESHVGQPYG